MLHGYCLGLHNILQVVHFEVDFFLHFLEVAYFLFLLYIYYIYDCHSDCVEKDRVRMLHTYLTPVRGLRGPAASVYRPARWTRRGPNKYLKRDLWVIVLDSQWDITRCGNYPIPVCLSIQFQFKSMKIYWHGIKTCWQWPNNPPAIIRFWFKHYWILIGARDYLTSCFSHVLQTSEKRNVSCEITKTIQTVERIKKTCACITQVRSWDQSSRPSKMWVRAVFRSQFEDQALLESLRYSSSL